ncbi:hypothetical protein L596_004085 [Steinernema carpocapsae]|uniref:Uncharacterized protein n=1 Tax=Steinernema carpocapsae TaxID=34508 RepID=A0A4U8UUT0_STECR|nr:hypothetical protein L596_004085 [Steinernema carpocapsae]
MSGENAGWETFTQESSPALPQTAAHVSATGSPQSSFCDQSGSVPNSPSMSRETLPAVSSSVLQGEDIPTSSESSLKVEETRKKDNVDALFVERDSASPSSTVMQLESSVSQSPIGSSSKVVSISVASSTTVAVGCAPSALEQQITPTEIVKTAVKQSPVSKIAPWSSKGSVLIPPTGSVRAKYVIGGVDEGPTVRQHLQQQQFAQRQQKLQQQLALGKSTNAGAEAAAQALTNSLIQPGGNVRVTNPTQISAIRMQLTPANASSPPTVRHVLKVPAASVSAPPPRTDSPLWNPTSVKQESGDERPDSVASEGALPRASEAIVKAEAQWASPVETTPTFVSGSDISMLVKPGPSHSNGSEQPHSQSTLIHTEHGLVQLPPGAEIRSSLSGPVSLQTSLIIQTVPRLSGSNSLSNVLTTTNSSLSGPICTVINGSDANTQNKAFVGSSKIIQRIPRIVTAPPQNRDDKHYMRKIAFMKRTIRSLVFKNGALCDEVARLNQRIQTVTEERKMLCKRLQHHERNRIRRLQTQLKKADAQTAKAAAKEPEEKVPAFYGEIIAKAAAEAQMMVQQEDSAEDSERTLSPSPTPSSMSPTPVEADEQMAIESPPSCAYSESNSKDNGMDYESLESSPRHSSPSSSYDDRKTMAASPLDRRSASSSHHDMSTPSSYNEAASPMDSSMEPPVEAAIGRPQSTKMRFLHPPVTYNQVFLPLPIIQ